MRAYCPNCRAEVDPEALVCPACRQRLSSLIVRAAEPPPVEPGAPQHTDVPSSSARVGASSIRMAWMAVIGAVLLGLVLFVVLIARALSGTPASPTAAQNPVVLTPPAASAPGTVAPSSPTASPVPHSGSAHFVRVTTDLPGGHCTTSQGCPVTGTFKNTGGRGGGTATFSLLDSSGNVVGIYSAPLPVTDPGGTVDVSGYASGDQLPAYLKSGGQVQLQVSVTNT
jgi:hypothetical protein